MNINLLEALDAFEKEKGISKDALINIIQKSITSAYKKNYGTKNVEVLLDKSLTALNVFQIWKITETVNDPNEEISLEDALKMDSKAVLGGEIRKKINPKKDFNRIATQTAKQVIMQNIKELEKNTLFEKYVPLKDKITNAEVSKVSPDGADIRIGKLETKLPVKDMIPNESMKQGDLVKVYIKDVQYTSKGPRIIVSRTVPEFIKELLKTIVPEIEEDIVSIVRIYREPGIRTKIAVSSKDPKVDPVGSCIGENSSRISELINEVKGEKVDIIRYSDDPSEFIKNSLAPAEVLSITLSPDKKEAVVTVPESQFSLAIGKGGQTARAAAKLTGWKIDIHTPA